jgi:branched-chain amino acid transport system permease protein
MRHTPAQNRQRPSGCSGSAVTGNTRGKYAGREDLEVLVFAVFNGLLYGALLFMLSSGLTLIFSMMGVLNFAHASFFMLGAYFAYSLTRFFGFFTALLVAPVIVGVIGALVERYGLRRVHRYGHVAELLFTFGLAALIGELVQLIWGRVNVPYEIPEAMRATAFTLQGLDYSIYRVFMLLVSVAIFLALALLLTRTRVGLIIQAALTHPEMVGALGHNLDRIFMLTFGFGCGLAGLAGVIGGNVLGTEPAMAIQLGSIIFVVIVIGGLGSLSGALAASLIIGVLDNIANTFSIPFAPFFRLFGITAGMGGIWNDLARITGSSIAPVLPYLLLVVMLIVRPRGLLGKRDV